MNSFKKLFRAVVKGWPEKVVCMVLALFLFLFYRLTNLEERFFSIPLRVESSGEMVPSAPFLQAVRISLRGEQSEIYPVLEEDVVSFIDISAFTDEGEYSVPVQTRLSGTAVGIDPLEVVVDPSEVTVKLERRTTKLLPVSLVLTGFPSEGYEFGSSAVNPSALEVSGPRSVVESVTELKTEPVSLSGRNAGFDGSAEVVLGNEFLSFTNLSSVSYRVFISEVISERRFENIHFSFVAVRPGFEFEASAETGSLRILAPETELSSWNPPPELLSVYCGDVTEPGEYTLEVRANIPQQFTLLQLEPEEILVTFRERAE